MSARAKFCLKWGYYWAITLIIYLILSLYFDNLRLYLPLPLLAGLNFALRLFFGALIGRVGRKSIRVCLLILLNLATVALAVWLCLSVVNRGSVALEDYIQSLDYSGFRSSGQMEKNADGSFTVRAEKDELRVLQLTDVHLCGSLTTLDTDRKAIDACYDVIAQAKPDLIIVTGDIVYPAPFQTFNRNNLKPFYQFCLFMEKVGIPWSMVLGNHDTEPIAIYGPEPLMGIFNYFINEPDHALLYSPNAPEISGRYNNYLRIENRDGSLNRLIFLIDSNDYVPGTTDVHGYDSVHADQIEWYRDTIERASRQEGETVRSFVFMHIPFVQYADAWSDLLAGGQDSVYLFGQNGEKVSHPDKDSGFFDAILEAGSTDAVFVGHDHLNNMGIRYKGVDLVYSLSIDYIAYPGIADMDDQRGGTLIRLSPNGYEIEQIHHRTD